MCVMNFSSAKEPGGLMVILGTEQNQDDWAVFDIVILVVEEEADLRSSWTSSWEWVI